MLPSYCSCHRYFLWKQSSSFMFTGTDLKSAWFQERNQELGGMKSWIGLFPEPTPGTWKNSRWRRRVWEGRVGGGVPQGFPPPPVSEAAACSESERGVAGGEPRHLPSPQQLRGGPPPRTAATRGSERSRGRIRSAQRRPPTQRLRGGAVRAPAGHRRSGETERSANALSLPKEFAGRQCADCRLLPAAAKGAVLQAAESRVFPVA